MLLIDLNAPIHAKYPAVKLWHAALALVLVGVAVGALVF